MIFAMIVIISTIMEMQLLCLLFVFFHSYLACNHHRRSAIALLAFRFFPLLPCLQPPPTHPPAPSFSHLMKPRFFWNLPGMSIFPFKNEAITSTLEKSIFFKNSLPPPAVSPPSSFPFPFFHNGIQKLSPPPPPLPKLEAKHNLSKKHKIEKNIWIPKAEAPFSRRGDEFRNSAIGASFALFSYGFSIKINDFS